ncbi:MAG: hypothetical protein WC617_03870 [Rhodanobacter sp.]|jgi:nucleotide-binding universal stress UspA family protein
MYSTLMVYLEPGRGNTHVLKVARDLAERSGATVIGVAASRLMQLAYTVTGLSGDIFELDRQEIDRGMDAAGQEFRAAFQGTRCQLQWRTIVTTDPPVRQLASQARSADVLVVGADRSESRPGSTHDIDTSDLVMRSGRPVLIVPARIDNFPAQNVIVAWSDSREARRAIADGLPLFRAASRVLVVQVAAADHIAAAREGLADVVGWLKRHGIEAEAMAAPETGDHALQLAAIASNEAADLIVAGAYGHSRLHEWALGGVTYDLLLRSRIPALLSH